MFHTTRKETQMKHEKEPKNNDPAPAYPDLEDAAIHRRKFFALLAGSTAAATLFGACKEDNIDHSGAPFWTEGEPPDVKNPETLRTGGVPRRITPPTSVNDTAGSGTPDAGKVPHLERNPGQAPRPAQPKDGVKKIKKKKPKKPNKLGGAPLKPDFAL